jgi:hypothetical protein
MTLPSTGAISLNQINTELGYSGTAQVSFNDAAIRSFLARSSGVISFDDARGRSQASITIASDQYQYDLYTALVNAGVYSAGKTRAFFTINGGVVVGSTTTGAYALTSQSFTSGDTVYLTNNGYIVGAGGAGGSASSGGGGAGGPALYAGYPITVTNNGAIWGGGGGGGGGANGGDGSKYPAFVSGGGGGGGAGQYAGGGGSPSGSSGSLTAGGAGRTPGGTAGRGGTGGGPGAAGETTNGPGGAAGYYVGSGGNVTWVTSGDLRGQAG